MVLYICKKCDKEFNRKFLYNQHQNRKTDCSIEKSKNAHGSKTNKKKDYICKKCGGGFDRKDSLIRHSKTCKCKNKKIKGSNNINANGNTNGNTNGNDNIMNNNKSKITVNKDNTNINIILLEYPPDHCRLLNDISEILSSNDNLIMEIIKKTNTNKNRPEHHNIYYPDLKNAVGEIYKDNKWNPKTIDEITNIMIENNTDCLRTYLKYLGILLDEETTNKIENTCKEFYNPDARKKLTKHIKLLLFEHRNMIKNTKNGTKNETNTETNNETKTETNNKTKNKTKSETNKKINTKTKKKTTIKHISSSSESE
jgi:hypothetical protein